AAAARNMGRRALILRRVRMMAAGARGRALSGRNREALSTDAANAGGPARSSDETPVMGAERRGRLICGLLSRATRRCSGRRRVSKSGPEGKPFQIPKRLVWEAYKSVKANKGAAGVDGQSIEDFEKDLKDTVFLVTAVCGKPGRAFCARRECRCRPVLTSVCSVARLVSSASAARAARDVPAVTLDWAIEPTAWCRAAVKDTWSVVTGPLPARRRSPRAAAASVARDAAALARTSWVAVTHAQNSWMTSRGDPGRSTGPEVRSPAPVMVVLSSPNVVSDADQRDWQAPRTCPASTAWWSSSVVIRVHVSETSWPSPHGRTALCSATRTGSRSLVLPLGAFSQLSRQRQVALGPGHHVPAGIQDRGDDLMAGEVPVECEHPAGEQFRPAADQPGQPRLLPGPRLPGDRPQPGPARPCGHHHGQQLRERRRPRPFLMAGARAAEHGAVRRGVSEGDIPSL